MGARPAPRCLAAGTFAACEPGSASTHTCNNQGAGWRQVHHIRGRGRRKGGVCGRRVPHDRQQADPGKACHTAWQHAAATAWQRGARRRRRPERQPRGVCAAPGFYWRVRRGWRAARRVWPHGRLWAARSVPCGPRIWHASLWASALGLRASPSCWPFLSAHVRQGCLPAAIKRQFDPTCCCRPPFLGTAA